MGGSDQKPSAKNDSQGLGPPPRPSDALFEHAYQRLLGEHLIFGRTRKPSEQDANYRARQQQEEQLALLVAQGLCKIPYYSEQEQREAQENARVYEQNRRRRAS